MVSFTYSSLPVYNSLNMYKPILALKAVQTQTSSGIWLGDSGLPTPAMLNNLQMER